MAARRCASAGLRIVTGCRVRVQGRGIDGPPPSSVVAHMCSNGQTSASSTAQEALGTTHADLARGQHPLGPWDDHS
jgi:hypothetical protein